MEQLRRFALRRPMYRGHHYRWLDLKAALWEWRMRTVRLGGVHVDGPDDFIIAGHVLVRDLKRRQDGRSRYCAVAAGRFREDCRQAVAALGLVEAVWRGEPDDGTA
jgi:hypothetical protein